VAESQGVSLLFVPNADAKHSHQIITGMEDPKQGVFEDARNVCQFRFDHEELEEVGRRLRGLAENLGREEFQNRFFRPDDNWWQD
jgi:hypothetical protein